MLFYIWLFHFWTQKLMLDLPKKKTENQSFILFLFLLYCIYLYCCL